MGCVPNHRKSNKTSIKRVLVLYKTCYGVAYSSIVQRILEYRKLLSARPRERERERERERLLLSHWRVETIGGSDKTPPGSRLHMTLSICNVSMSKNWRQTTCRECRHPQKRCHGKSRGIFYPPHAFSFQVQIGKKMMGIHVLQVLMFVCLPQTCNQHVTSIHPTISLVMYMSSQHP